MTPGFVNAHTHMYSGLAPLGMPEPVPEPNDFPEILERVWWRLDRALDADSLRASAQLYVSEAIERGTTALIDHHESPNFIEGSLDILGDTCQELGMRAVLCYGATERNGGMDEAAHGLEECHRFLTNNHRPLVRGVVGLHASFTVSDETIREAVTLARALSTVLHLHVAEDGVDVHDALERGYAGVVDRLHKLGALIPGSIFAHGVHLTVDEVERCAANGCWLVQNPRSNRVGYPPFLAHSDRVALGTDGYPADMRAEEEVLLALANRADDDLPHARSRLEAGHRLIEERFGNGNGESGTAPARLDESPMRAIRDEAEAEAERLWERMRDLPPRPGEEGDDPP